MENVNLTSVVGGHFEYVEGGQLAEVLDSMGLFG